MGRLVTGSDNVHAGSGLVNRIFSVLKRLNLQDLLLDMLRKLGCRLSPSVKKDRPALAWEVAGRLSRHSRRLALGGEGKN